MRTQPILLALSIAAAATAQTVDFEKQVRPILVQRCHSCHGEEVQQSGLRLDKRQNAMRGGDYGPVIIPGNAAASKLIRRVINGDGGMQMPPSGALPPEEVAILKAWIDQGADFRLEIKEEAPPAPVDPKLTALISSIRSGAVPKSTERQSTEKQSIEKQLINAKDAAGSTPLHHAAGFAPLATVKFLLENGADVNARNRRGSTPLHWSLTDEARVRLLLEKGANINARQADGRTPLYSAATAANANGIIRLLLDKGADPNLATANGQTPLMAAAARGDVETMRMLLAQNVDVNIRNGAGATALMGAAASRNPRAVELLLAKGADPDAATKLNETPLANAATAGVEESVKLLLDKGAKVNTHDTRGYTPLMYAAASEVMPTGIVKMLLAKGADTSVIGEDETARSLAAKRGDTEIARLLGVSEAERRQGGIAELPKPTAHRPVSEAVRLALDLLEKQSHNFIRISGCNSCHAQDLPSAAAGIARDHGMPAPREIVQIPESLNGETPERMMDLIAASVPSIGWEMFDRAANHAPRDAYSDAAVRYLRAMQAPEGYWKTADGRRPPMNSGDMQTTALAVLAIRQYGNSADSRILARAAAWLEKAQPETTQERAFQLLGLGWANASQDSIRRAARIVADTQRPDGGWNQLPGMGSDAYATGQSLYALRTAGHVAASDATYQKGLGYLLTTQAADGSWHVKTRSIWIQPYFQSGFPYDHDQWISAAGTAWASMALSVSVDTQEKQVRAARD